MLENIKMLLGINPDDKTKDGLINYYIKAISTKALNYCNLTSIPTNVEPFIENKVVLILKAPSVANNVKSIQRGDTRFDYAEQKGQSELLNLTDEDKKELNSFRKVKCI